MIHLPESIPVLGIALVLAVVAGKFAHYIRVPQVTAYIILGVLLGPSCFNLMTVEVAQSYHLINEVAFGLILFNIGGEFHKKLLTRVAWRHVQYSVLLCSITVVFVFIICFLFGAMSGFTVQQNLAFSSVLGIISIAAAPPTTLLVLKEFEADGPLTESIMVYLAISTILSLVGSHAALLVFQDTGLWEGMHGNIPSQVTELLWSLIGSVFFGLGMGIMLSYWEHHEKSESEQFLAVVCAILLGQTAAYYLRLEPLLVSLFTGFSIANSSRAGLAIHRNIKGTGLGIYALFFVLAGAHLHIQEQAQTIGLLGLGYLVARTSVILFGSRIAARLSGESEVIGKYMGLALLSHAGAALAIAGKLQSIDEVAAQSIVTVIMASIFVFEIGGPLLLKKAVFDTEEAGITNLKTASTSKTSLSLGQLAMNLLRNIGVIKQQEASETISAIVSSNILAIQHDASLEEVVKFMKTTRQPLYPVVHADSRFEGTLGIWQLNKALNENLDVTAEQLIENEFCLTEETLLNEAQEVFSKITDPCLPVVDSKTQRLAGFLDRKVLILALHS